MADKRAPDNIRKDDELKKEFPPAPLVELFHATEGTPIGSVFLHWRSPKMIAREKAWDAFHSALASDASIEQAREEGRRAFRS
jgi:hypothetical protein